MNISIHLLIVVLAAVGCPLVCSAGDRPNVLWLVAEDMSPNLGCYGDPDAATPCLDRLAQESILYENAFGVSGVCAVCRSSLITGMYPSAIGSQGMRSNTTLPDQIDCFSETLRQAGYYCTNCAKTDYNFPTPAGAWDENSQQAHYRNRAANQPFFAVFNYNDSHESVIRAAHARFSKVTQRLTPEQRHDPQRVTVPPFHPDVPAVRRDWARYHDLVTSFDYWVADRLAELEKAGLAEDTVVFVYSDHGAGMPGCKKWVWESGLHVPLIIRVPVKFRSPAAGNPGSRTSRLVSFVDFAPTVLSLAGVPMPAHMQGSAFLGEQAGSPREAVYAMRDRMGERHDTVRVVRDKRFQYLRNFRPDVSWSQYMSYTEEMPTMQTWRRMSEAGELSGPAARYFSPTKPIEEIYETATDPWQIHNLADDPRFAEDLKRLREECVSWMLQTGDLGLLPEHELFSRAAGRTPYELAMNPQDYPLPDLLAAAELANAMDPDNIPELTRLMRYEDDAGLRWWGAIGLVSLREQAMPALADLLTALNDPAPDVRVAAADALCYLGQFDEALPVLAAAIQHESEYIQLPAMIVLDRAGDKALPVIGLMKNVGTNTAQNGHVSTYLKRMAIYVPEKIKGRHP